MSVDTRDFSELSDDEVMNLSLEDFERMSAAGQETQDPQDDPENQGETEEERQAREAQEQAGAQDNDDEDEDDPQGQADPDKQDDELEEQEEENLSDEEVEARAAAQGAKPAKGKSPEEQDEDPAQAAADKNKPKGKDKDTSSDGFDAEEGRKLFGEFKANGRKMQIRNADEGIRLMQLGAGYNAKMEELKPKLAILRTLEREGLLDSDKLGFLIDLNKKNPEAIGKLVKDSGIDVLDLDSSKVDAYKPELKMTSVKEVEMDEVLDGLKHTGSYNTLMDTVANKWDSASKGEVGNNPQLLKVISDHMEAGYYDLIMDEFERKKALGEIPSGTPFLQAYAKIGDDLNAAGKFSKPESQPARRTVTPGKDKARAAREAEEQRRKAAAPTRKSGSPAPRKPVVDVWSMSDEDFQKLQVPR